MCARILIIEDNQTNLDLMTYLLEAFGHTVLAAKDGQAGYETILRERPDLIVCDIQIPKMDGYEVARRVKQHPVTRPIPLVAVTALAMVGDREKVIAAGFDSYVAKPIAPQTFVREVEAFLKSGETVSKEDEPAGPSEIAQSTRGLILVVDNSYVNLALAQSTLEPFGYRVLEAHSGTEALALIEHTRPDLILSDLHMPGKDGYDLIREIKADPRFSSIPFVFISSTVWRESDRLTGLALGACKFILRPIEPQALVAEIEKFLNPSGKA